MKKRFLPVLMIMVLIITMLTPCSFAASSKKMTVYYDVVKYGNTAFVNTPDGIYKVNIKKGTSKLFKGSPGWQYAIGDMRAYKGYLYFTADNDETEQVYLYRANIKTGKLKVLTKATLSTIYFSISKGKIYYTIHNEIGQNTKKVMKLNGKAKKKTKIKAVNVYKASNAKGYKVIEENTSEYKIIKLKTPKKTITVCKIPQDEWPE